MEAVIENIMEFWPIITIVGGWIVASIVAVVNMKRDIREVQEKVNRMDEGHDKRLAALEGTLRNIEISTGKIETKVELLLTQKDL